MILLYILCLFFGQVLVDMCAKPFKVFYKIFTFTKYDCYKDGLLAFENVTPFCNIPF